MDRFDSQPDAETYGDALPSVSDIDTSEVSNGAIAAALDRIQARTRAMNSSHYTKHSSHSQKHSTTW